MRSLLILISLLLSGLWSEAQTAKPIRWTFSLSKNEVKQGDVVEIIMKAEINNEWYLYSSDFSPELGPTVSSISFTTNNSFKTAGNLTPIGAKEKYDSLWEGKIRYFVHHGEFRQKVKILTTKPVIKAILSYQVCSDKEGKCIPYDENISFDQVQLKVIAVQNTSTNTTPVVDTKGVPKNNTPEVKPTVETKDKLTALEVEKSKLVEKDNNGNDLAVEQLKKFSQKYGGDK